MTVTGQGLSRAGHVVQLLRHIGYSAAENPRRQSLAGCTALVSRSLADGRGTARTGPWAGSLTVFGGDVKQPAREVLLRADSAWRTSDRRAAAGRGFQFGAAELFTPNSCSGGKGARPNGRLRRAAPQLPQKPRQPAVTGLCMTAQPRQQAGSSSPGTASRVYLRWRIFERIRRFFRPSFRRPLPDFFVPMRRSVLSATYTVLTG